MWDPIITTRSVMAHGVRTEQRAQFVSKLRRCNPFTLYTVLYCIAMDLATRHLQRVRLMRALRALQDQP